MDMGEIERKLANHEERISNHGAELDEYRDRIVKLETTDKFRADQMTRIEGKLDKQSGKMDSLSVQISQVQQTPAREKADKWDKVTYYILTAIIGAILGAVMASVGI